MTTSVPTSCIDYKGRVVVVPRWFEEKIKRGYPEMASHVSKVCDVLKDPDYVYFRERTDGRLFYKLGILSDPIARNYMLVIVVYQDDVQGVIKTTYSTGRPALGDRLIHIKRRR